ncbi:endosomal P24B protein [Trypanosoma theileri]|uniref:Endosomal P24B protein n=1 Tax=Trypanosoma theileri TaxID=67003 RepID=A0A1X0NKZ3_9TRYP|nr:endosomal P24B protein [Trypanosoma theileri]ORC84829.1 endosomal P24B protein [Trypanosoma theileri]
MLFPRGPIISPSSSSFSFSSVFLFFLLFTLFFSLGLVEAVSTRLDAGDSLCLQEPVTPQSTVTFQFQVTNKGKNDNGILVVLTDQDGNEIHHWENAMEGIYEVHAQNGIRLLNACLENIHSFYSHTMVDFHFRYHVDYSTVAKVSELDPIERSVESIARNMRSVEELQMHLRTQQKEHRNTVEEANERLLLWSVFQVVALVGMSIFQLYFLKRFLERKSFV